MNWEKLFDLLAYNKDFMQSVEPFKQELELNSTDTLPFFAEEDFYTEYYPLCGRDDAEKVYPAIKSVVRILKTEPLAARYANMIHYGLFRREKLLAEVSWATTEKIFGDNAGIFNLLIALSALPFVRRKHIELGLDESFMYGIARWIGGFAGVYEKVNHHAGHPLANLYWLRFSINGELFRIGRLEFLPRPWNVDMPHIYKNRKTNQMVVLCRNNWTFDKNLLRVAPESPEVEFIAELVVANNHVSGTAVLSSGMPDFEKKTVLNLDEWELYVKDGEQCVSLHIPCGGGMTPEAVNRSLKDAVTFYKKMFDTDVKIFFCTSWLFNPVWQKELPDSNIARWQRNSFMTPPLIADGISGLFFIYGQRECDPRRSEAETSLHRAFCRIFDRQEKLRAGAMFILAENIYL